MWVRVTRYALHCLPRLAMTRQGAAYRLGGRDLNADLQPHWRRLLVERFGAASAAGCSLDEDWRGQYEEQERQLSEKAERIKAKVQGMFKEARQQKQQRCAQVQLSATGRGDVLSSYRSQLRCICSVPTGDCSAADAPDAEACVGRQQSTQHGTVQHQADPAEEAGLCQSAGCQAAGGNAGAAASRTTCIAQ